MWTRHSAWPGVDAKFVNDTFVEQMDRWNVTLALLDHGVPPLWLFMAVRPEQVT